MKLHKKFTFKWRDDTGVTGGTLYTAEREGAGFRVTWTGCINGALYWQGELERSAANGNVQEIRPIISAEDILAAPEGTKIKCFTKTGSFLFARRGNVWFCGEARWRNEALATNFASGVWTATDIEYPETTSETKATVEDSTIGTVFKFTTPLDKNGDMKYEAKKTAETTWECSWQNPGAASREIGKHCYTSQEISENIKGGWNVYAVVKPAESIAFDKATTGVIVVAEIEVGTLTLDPVRYVRWFGATTSFSDRNDKAWSQKHNCSITYRPDGTVVLDAGWARMYVEPGQCVQTVKKKMGEFLGTKG